MAEIRNDLSLELGLRGSRISGTEGDSECQSGRVFWDEVSSGRRANFERI